MQGFTYQKKKKNIVKICNLYVITCDSLNKTMFIKGLLIQKKKKNSV